MSTTAFKFYFDGTNPQWSDKIEFNEMFLNDVRNHMHDRLRRRGYLLLNDVLDALGVPQIREGLTMGWTDPNFFTLRFERQGTMFVVEVDVRVITEVFHTYEQDEEEEVDVEYTAVGVFADWQVFGDEDLDVSVHLEGLVTAAQHEGHTIRDLVINASAGTGLCYIHFSVVVDVAMEQVHDSDELKTVVKQYLDGVVHDSDVSVRWAQVIG